MTHQNWDDEFDFGAHFNGRQQGGAGSNSGSMADTADSGNHDGLASTDDEARDLSGMKIRKAGPIMMCKILLHYVQISQNFT